MAAVTLLSSGAQIGIAVYNLFVSHHYNFFEFAAISIGKEYLQESSSV